VAGAAMATADTATGAVGATAEDGDTAVGVAGAGEVGGLVSAGPTGDTTIIRTTPITAMARAITHILPTPIRTGITHITEGDSA